jgi:flagellar basal body P-ring formation protein FlgA
MRLMFVLVLLPCTAMAESLVALRTIPARSVIASADIAPVDAVIAGAVTDITMAIGQEARITLYAGQPILQDNLSAPALVERNQIVTLVFDVGNLTISAEGRALDRAGLGEPVRAMNLSSRTTVRGIVGAGGTVLVSQQQKEN